MKRRIPPASAEWVPVDPFGTISPPSFVSGDSADDRLRVAYFRRGEDEGLLATVWFGSKAQGPPHYAHGGSIAAVLDESMGAVAWMAGHTAVVARLTVIYSRPLPLRTDAVIHSRITRKEGRKIWVRGCLTDSQGSVFAEARGLFISLHVARLGESA